MLILAADTSGKNGSLALVRFETDSARTLEVVPLEGGTFSAQLVPQISALLAKHSLMKDEIDAFAVVSGPGSFTGLRVGLAAVKALAEILQKPIASVSLLEIVARAAEMDGRVMAALDAGRDEMYVGIYECKGHTFSTVAEELLSLDELRSRASASGVVTPDQKLAERLKQENVNVTVIPQPRADSVAKLGVGKIRKGEVVSPEALDATYIRRSAAEIVHSRRISR
jgi:tRNA threonylcarbamoyladenosine biosynthesis protein TsaB